MPTSYIRAFDAAGVTLSGLCMVHCLALPLAAAALPFLAAWTEAHWVHWLFVAAALPTSLAALLPGAQGRTGVSLLGMGALGIALLALAAAEWPTHEVETPMSVAGGAVLATAHLLNWRRPGRRHGCEPSGGSSQARFED